AATARVNMKLADFATVNLSGNMMTPGFGSIEKKVSERSRENQTNYDVSTQVELGKFFGDKSGIRLPLFYGFGETFITPQYNPLDPDILLKPVLNSENLSKSARDSIRSATVDYTRRKSINFTNVHKERSKGKKKSYFWDVENFTVSFAYTELYHHNVNIDYSTLRNYRGGLTYSYSPQIKPLKPFEKATWAKSKWLTLLREMSINPAPTMLGFSSDMNRQYGETKNRNITGFSDVFTPTYFNKTFVWTRSYDLRWDLTKNLKFDFSADNLANVLEPNGKIDTKEKRDELWTNVKGFGTTMSYHHTTNVTYNIPLNKIPLFDWITPTVRYSSGFSWQRAPLSADSVANTVGNNAKWDYTAQLNMTTLYNHSKYLKKVNSKKPGEKPAAQKSSTAPKEVMKKPMTAADSLKAQQKKDSLDKANNQYVIVEYLARLMMSLRTVSASYSVNSTLGLPGYLPKTHMMGFDKNFDGPGLGFLFGQQDNFGKDNVSYPEYAIQHNWLTHTQGLYTPYTQGTSKNLTLRATMEPFPDVRIELTANMTSAINNSEFIHWNPTSESFDSLSHTQTGSFSMSIISWHSAFVKDNKTDHSSRTFTQFLNNRAVISKRLGEANPNSSGLLASGYADGYGSVQQDVIIPAFIAAYTGKKAESTSLSSFPSIPLPNWHITYDGLTKYAPVKKYFKTIAINHTYRSTYSL
ncbi:MAG TPA: cell surface protein SprA, partial [Bacteroidia bacterium]|nr:cell surface protein SprA [Bacteroidia bacterium]